MMSLLRQRDIDAVDLAAQQYGAPPYTITVAYDADGNEAQFPHIDVPEKEVLPCRIFWPPPPATGL